MRQADKLVRDLCGVTLVAKRGKVRGLENRRKTEGAQGCTFLLFRAREYCIRSRICHELRMERILLFNSQRRTKMGRFPHHVRTMSGSSPSLRITHETPDRTSDQTRAEERLPSNLRKSAVTY